MIIDNARRWIGRQELEHETLPMRALELNGLQTRRDFSTVGFEAGDQTISTTRRAEFVDFEYVTSRPQSSTLFTTESESTPMENQSMRDQLSMDRDNLYQEETFTDHRVGTLQRLTPVTPEGEFDAQRKVRYFGQTQVMSPAGALPINFELEVDSLDAAIDGFAEAAETAVEETIEKIKKLQREAQSSIMVPGQDGGGQFGGMGPGGGIQL
jgi:hypothetical protein